MAEFDSPTCALDLRHRSNCLGIASAKSGQEIRVLVRPEDDPTAQLVVATGTLSIVKTSARPFEHFHHGGSHPHVGDRGFFDGHTVAWGAVGAH